MADSKTISLPMLSTIVLVSSIAAAAAAGRQFQEQTPDIPNFGFPELNPPAPEFEFRPPVNDFSSELKKKSRGPPDSDDPLGFRPSRWKNLPAPRFWYPFRPPVTDSKNEIAPNSGSPGSSPASAKLPFSEPVMRDLIARLELLVKLEKESRPKAMAPAPYTN